MPRPVGTNKCATPGCERGTIFTPWCHKHRKLHPKEVEKALTAYHAAQKKAA